MSRLPLSPEPTGARELGGFGRARRADTATRQPDENVRNSSGTGRCRWIGSELLSHLASIGVRILVVEDEAKVAGALKEGLEAEDYAVVVAGTGEDGFFRVSTETFDLILLDLMLPGRDGIEILATLRKRELDTPVLILTARDAVGDRVLGLDSGADDYLVKPFAFPELLARIRALVRRGRANGVLRLRAADLDMDLIGRRVTRGGASIELTTREFELLEYLLRHHRQLVSREMLAREVWREPSRATPLDNVIDVHIARLRKKIDHDARTKLIHTVRGVGFVLREDEP
jgi:DNA-binding response OmpR family regulator